MRICKTSSLLVPTMLFYNLVCYSKMNEFLIEKIDLLGTIAVVQALKNLSYMCEALH